MSSSQGVRIAREGRVGHLTLDRPQAINALTTAMVRTLLTTLVGWRDDPSVEVVVLDGQGERGFCAGGDIKFVHTYATREPERVRAFWRAEYELDAALANFPKPVVTVAHGITMGGGVGLASHAEHRIVTSGTRLAMPETLIGLAPDVAALHLLAQAPGNLGLHAAITASTMSSGDAVEMGFADAVVPDNRLRDLIPLLQVESPAAVMSELHAADAASAPILLPEQEWIRDCYAYDDIRRILGALRTHPAPEARRAGEVMASVSPTAAAVTLQAIRRAGEMASMQACLVQDFRVSSRFLVHPDLVEGIRARVIDKDRTPRWSPSALTDVNAEDVERFLAPFDNPADELAPEGSLPERDLRLVPRGQCLACGHGGKPAAEVR